MQRQRPCVVTPNPLWPPHQPATNGSPKRVSVPGEVLSGDEFAQFNMSEFLGTSSEKSEECSLTFPKANGNEILHVDDEIDMITKRIEFLRDMVDSPSRNTPTVIINRRGASQDEHDDEDVENTTPRHPNMRQVARDTIRQPFRRIDIANVRQKSKDSNIPRSMSPRPHRQGH